MIENSLYFYYKDDISKYNQSSKPDLGEKKSPKNDCFTINVNKLNQSLDLLPFHDFFTNEFNNNSLYYYFNVSFKIILIILQII